MPKKHKIVNGPAFRNFVFMSCAIAGSGDIISLTLTNRDFGEDRNSFYITLLGKESVGEREDEFVFIARSHSASSKMGAGLYWLVGTYNPITRKGQCVGYEQYEFFRAPIAQELFRDHFRRGTS